VPAHVKYDPQRNELTGDLDVLTLAWKERTCALALTGAGVSVESGIPDFRSECGLWTRFDPMEYATIDCFIHTPDKAWELYRELGKTINGKYPNPGHKALATLEESFDLMGIITQNIDGLHQAAGSSNVLEIHGRHNRLHCLTCGHDEPFEDRFLEPGPAPTCPSCGNYLKPDVVMFGEAIREADKIDAMVGRCRTMLVVGTSANVAPACLFPQAVLQSGGSVLEFNLGPTDLTRSGLGMEGVLVEGPVGKTLPLFLEQVVQVTGNRAP
jgi:NAD-dependent deacetylase